VIATLARLMRLCEPERPRLIRGLVATVVASLLWAVPAVTAVVVVLRLDDGDLEPGDAWWVGAITVGSLVARFAAARYANGILWVVGYEATGRLRHRILDTMRRDPDRAFGADAGRSLTVLTHDAGKLAGFIAWNLPVFVGSALLPAVVLVVVGVIEPWLAVPALAVALLSFPVLRFGIGRVVDVYARRRELQEDATDRMLEYVRGIDVIRAHDLAGERQASFDAALTAIRDADVASVKRLSPAYSGFQALVDAGLAAMLAAAAVLVARGSSTPDAIVAGLILSTVLLRPQLEIGARALHLPDLAPSLLRLEQWLQRPAPAPLPPVPLERAANGAVDVRFEDVQAAYPTGPPVLTALDLHVPAGSVLAVVGPSGAGKTTVLRLVAGLLAPTTGRVRLGGADLASMPAEQSAALVSAVFQDVGVLRGTVREVISAGDPDVELEQVRAAAQAARIDERILELPHGYDSVIGEEGRSLSGGERQRIAIARAICKDAPVVLLDEATSALDPTNELLVREALANLALGRTLIVVAHRLETIRHADHIVVLDAGRVVQSGTHDELLGADGRYAAFWETRQRAAGWRLGSAV
jgi:ATP-binding cassette subfamily B protein IrtB